MFNKKLEIEPSNSELLDSKVKLIDSKKCLMNLIGMNTLGAAAGSLVVRQLH